ncbi:RecQ family ATP-dependent DNA helicase [Natronoflexus pectinivorans]|uniref:ATP-dependent DNA helicase RecQ n=1 Tax=Natronoflexus pectinivorans TaxID=682526 RepID=A0A4V2RVB3_9BACT|nr:RecQ family ATP-dependent DNA helicase [Natronoflexus pectinivorans]TCO03654.1 ATP-dependent DNA helicase RecQ [Natronoflexus pectinivorans]
MCSVKTSLKNYFGFDAFRPGQEKVVNALLAGRSSAAIFPTGSGKSLCYQLAALHLPNLTLVVSPLLALISDQLESMEASGIPAARIDSTLNHKQMNQIREDVRSGKIKVLMVSVERFKNESFRRFLSGIPVSMMVVDEAHCISEWGHNFRPDYLKLPEYRMQFNVSQVLLLTATATPKVIEDMCRKFDIAKDDVAITGFFRENLHLSVIPAEESKKKDVLANLLVNEKSDSAIVYVTLQKTAEEVAAYLREKDIVAAAYHAGMNNADREAIQNGFMNGHIPVIVATIAFGMGIDKPDIRHVVHYDLPKSIESYSQEIGRAGRDGQVSKCTLLGNLDGLNVLENFVYGDTPELSGIKTLLGDIQKADNRWEVQSLKLSGDTNIRMLPLKTLLVYLEMEGIIKPLFSYFSTYRFKNVLDNDAIVAKFSGERAGFIKAIFDHSEKARTWTSVDFDAILSAYPADRQRIVSALDYFNEQGFIQLEAKQMIEVFEVLQSNFDVDVLASTIHQKFATREAAEVKRINDMVEFFGSDDCLSKTLSTYFGEQTNWEKCGTCSVCKKGAAKLKKTIVLPDLKPEDVKEHLSAFNDAVKGREFSPVVLTRFLCGIHTPVFSKIKASSIKGYGTLEHHRFREVLQMIN